MSGNEGATKAKGLKEGVIHINMLEDGELIKMPQEWVYEVKKKIGVFGANQTKGVGFALARIWKAGEHYHTETEEMYFVAKGRGTAYIDGVPMPIKEFDLLRIPPDTDHYAKCVDPDGFYVLAFTAPPWTPEDHHLKEQRRG